MINIFRVFLSDVKRLSNNVVAIVIIMGLTVIPALYACWKTQEASPFLSSSSIRIQALEAQINSGASRKTRTRS